MLRPKRRRWVNESWTRWVKSQQCVCCNKQADDPHHLIATDKVEWEQKRMTCLCCRFAERITTSCTLTPWHLRRSTARLELLFRFLDRSLAIGVLA